jgi:hypothetical protein
MTSVNEKLAKYDRELKSHVVFSPSNYTLRGVYVVRVGNWWSQSITDDVVIDYQPLQLEPPRRDPLVALYYLATERVGTINEFSYYQILRPYYWKKNGPGWSLFFPGVPKAKVRQVVEIPLDAKSQPIVLTGSVVLSHRDFSQKIRENRYSSWRKLTKRRYPKLYSALPPRKRPSPETINWNGINGFDNYWQVWTESPIQTLRYYRAYTSTVTPGFRSKHRGQLPVNPYSLTLIKVDDPMSSDVRIGLDVFPYGAQNTSRAYAPASNWSQIPGAPVHDVLAHNKALSHLIDHAEFGLDGNLAQDVAQFSQTTKMIADSATRIVGSVNFLKRGRIKEAWNVLMVPRSRGPGYRTSIPKGTSPSKSLAENWLALQYGWKPLLQDVDAAMRSLANYCVQSPYVVRTARGRGTATSKTKSALLFGAGPPVTGEKSLLTRTDCTIAIRYTIDSKLRSFLAQTGFTNPINLAYEIIPYSFVVDWFLPIGPYLSALSAFDGLTFLDGFESNFTRQYFSSIHCYNGVLTTSPYKVNLYKNARYWREYIIVNRTKLTSFPTMVMPQFKNPFSVTHSLNALALLRAAFR